MASGVFHADQLPVPETGVLVLEVLVEPAGVLTVETVETPDDQPSQPAEELTELVASGVLVEALLLELALTSGQKFQLAVAVLVALVVPLGVFVEAVEVDDLEELVAHAEVTVETLVPYAQTGVGVVWPVEQLDVIG